MKHQFFDSGMIYGFSRTPEGFLRGRARVSRIGILVYRDSATPGGFINVLRHPDDVFAIDSMNTARLIPVTNDHPAESFVTADNAKELSVGSTGDDVGPDGKFLTLTFVVTDGRAITDIEGGKRELSLGYEADRIYSDGEWDGKPFQARQINIRYNHLAIVDRARAGSEARIELDGAEFIDSTEQISLKQKDVLMKIVLDSGIEYETLPEVGVAYTALKRQCADSSDALATAQKTLDTTKAQLDSAQDELKTLKAVDHSKAIQDGVKARVDLIRKAETVLDSDIAKTLDGMSDAEIKSTVVKSAFPNANLDGVSSDYLNARFDTALEVKAVAGVNQDAADLRGVVNQPVLDGCAGDPQKNMMKRMTDRWKTGDDCAKK